MTLFRYLLVSALNLIVLNSYSYSGLADNNDKAVSSIMYKNFTPELLELYEKSNGDRANCEYFKNHALNYCQKEHSAEFDERNNCSIVYKQRWCLCMGKSNDCFRQSSFYW